MLMYQDWKQWARLVIVFLIMMLVWHQVQPWAIELYSRGIVPGWVQLSLMTISAGLIFPKARRFNYQENISDVTQLAYGILLFSLGLAATFLP
jgi:hypothetical protein